MSHALMCLILASCLGQTSQPTATQPLPPEWPPLPDFVHPVDYLKWFQEVSRVDPDEDAWPLWRELSEGSWSTLSEREYRWLWGVVSKDDWVPGLFTGVKTYTPDQYPWDPKDHWDWEESFELQQASGLAEKIRAAVQRSRVSCPTISFAGVPEGQDWGITEQDHLLFNALTAYLPHRGAAKVLLQNAWRAPVSHLDTTAMLDAVETTLRIAEQSRPSLQPICLSLNASVRELVYDNILAMLYHRVFKPDQLVQLGHILEQLDAQPVSMEAADAAGIASFFEILQFAYAQDRQTWELPPKLNEANWAKLEKLARFWSNAKEDQLPVDMHDQAVRCDPRMSVYIILNLRLEIRRIRRCKPPWQAVASVAKLKDSGVHVLARMFGTFQGGQMFCTQTEATRRAVHVLVALHQVHNRTGGWPHHLRQMKSVLDPGLLVDPFSCQEFVYRIENGQPLLYSVGLNGKDDGGVHDRCWGESEGLDDEKPKNADFVFWPIQILRTP